MKRLIFDLWLVPGLGPVKIRKMVAELLKSSQINYDEDRKQILEWIYSRFSVKTLSPSKIIDQSNSELEILEKNRIGYTTFFCDNYPSLLKEINNPPAVLYFKGDISCLNQDCIAIVGSRKNSDYASRQTENIIKQFSVKLPNSSIVSGLAYGIDSVAHHCALKHSLKTAAVLGSGLLKIYPPKNKKLSENILEFGGCLLSELPCTSEPLGVHFPLRNRIISGLSKAVLIMEAGEKSGSLITAKFALENSREVFALPGQVDYPSFAGTNRLIQLSQAMLLTSAEDVINELRHNINQPLILQEEKKDYSGTADKNIVPLTENPGVFSDEIQVKILSELSKGDSHEDILIQKINIAFPELLVKLTQLELTGCISKTDNGNWRKN